MLRYAFVNRSIFVNIAYFFIGGKFYIVTVYSEYSRWIVNVFGIFLEWKITVKHCRNNTATVIVNIIPNICSQRISQKRLALKNRCVVAYKWKNRAYYVCFFEFLNAVFFIGEVNRYLCRRGTAHHIYSACADRFKVFVHIFITFFRDKRYILCFVFRHITECCKSVWIFIKYRIYHR